MADSRLMSISSKYQSGLKNLKLMGNITVLNGNQWFSPVYQVIHYVG